jgi:biotin transport system permease protein
MIQMYRPGTSIVHRMPAAAKLAIFAALAIGVSAYPHDVWSTGVTVIGVGALFLLARLPLRVLGAEVWRLRWLALVLGAALWIFVAPLAAWISTSRVISLVLLASLLTITMIPVVASFAHEVRDAQRARGVRLGIRGVVPLLVRTLRHADDVGDALAARGLV